MQHREHFSNVYVNSREKHTQSHGKQPLETPKESPIFITASDKRIPSLVRLYQRNWLFAEKTQVKSEDTIEKWNYFLLHYSMGFLV